MFLDSWADYLRPSNSSRISGLSVYDPFAIAGFIMLMTMIPVALILLLVTARQSASSVWDGLEFDWQIRDREREADRRRRSLEEIEAELAHEKKMGQRDHKQVT
jgi:hypothetical protein